MICKKTNRYTGTPRTQYQMDMQAVAIANFGFLVRKGETLTNAEFADRIASYSQSAQAQEVAVVMRAIPD
jgi:antirestriction protein ArdC